ncbi:hypothetical protein PAT01_21250 [Pseudoalteromonas atlantica]|uniref:Uncharacterized protein n=1 Tax=Pseudoalteromonas atlantica TaxID=288 RepID=A0ABQ0UF32_PSEAF|nr:hypothetical protein PAT01_21250 [Pseudoalteromonas atlantica]
MGSDRQGKRLSQCIDYEIQIKIFDDIYLVALTKAQRNFYLLNRDLTIINNRHHCFEGTSNLSWKK